MNPPLDLFDNSSISEILSVIIIKFAQLYEEIMTLLL